MKVLKRGLFLTKMFNTGADYALSIIGGKWKPVILYLLANHPRRTGELVKQLGTLHKVLSDQLRELSDAGIVVRKSFNTIPPHVEYRLTPEGENLDAALRYLNYWVSNWFLPIRILKLCVPIR